MFSAIIKYSNVPEEFAASIFRVEGIRIWIQNVLAKAWISFDHTTGHQIQEGGTLHGGLPGNLKSRIVSIFPKLIQIISYCRHNLQLMFLQNELCCTST
jgi:hypothetical protein